MAYTAGDKDLSPTARNSQIFLTVRTSEIEVFLALAAHKAAKGAARLNFVFQREIFIQLRSALIYVL